MGARFDLCNFTRRERISCSHLGADKAREFIWNWPAGALALWYLFRHRGDQIAFVSDYDCLRNRTFFGVVATDELVNSFPDVTEPEIAAAVAAGILEDHGISYRDEIDPDIIYSRDVRITEAPGSLPPDRLHD